MKMLTRLEKSIGCWFLIVISVVFFFLRFPSLFEPNWYGDEGIYQVLGTGMNAGRLLYRDVFDNKPPLLYFLYTLVSSDQFAIRLLSLMAGILAIGAFYFLAKKLFENRKAVFISTGFFAILFGLPLIEGNIANAENFMLFPNILGAILVLKSLETDIQNKKTKLLLYAGFILGISFLLKIVALFDFAAFTVFLVFANSSKKLLDVIKIKNLIGEFKTILPFILGFVTPILLVTVFFLINDAFSYFLKAVLFNNVGYVNYGNKFIIPQGLLIFKLILLSLFSLFIFSKRKIYGNSFMLILLWLGFSLFNAYFSQRPYTHYVLVLLPAFSLTIGLFIVNKNFSKLSGVVLLTTLIAVLLSFSFYTKTVFYYQNFVSFLTQQKSVYEYQRFFDRNTPNDYDIAGYINTHSKPSDNIFIWGNNAQVYTLTQKLPPGRYTVAYHITNYKDGFENTKVGLLKSNPKFIVVMPNTSAYPFSLFDYSLKMNLNGIEIYEKFY
nr:glycosyltransferase family 39 protein [Candidatus Levybacteria bacterium]